MKRIALPHPTSNVFAPLLTRPEEASDRLMVWIQLDGSKAAGAAFVDAYVSEGWNVLEVGIAGENSHSAARDIVDAVRQAHLHLSYASAMFIADRGTAAAVCRAIILARQDGLLRVSCGLVTIDAFAESDILTLCGELAALGNLTTIWAVNRTDGVLRRTTFEHHTALQTQGRETHFLVLPDAAQSLAEHLMDARDPLGRGARWLLEPVHSRSS